MVAFGLRAYKIIQKPLLAIGIGGPIVLLICVAVTSRAGFVQSWNELATQYQSFDYNGFLAAVGQVAGGSMPQTWNWHDTIGMMSPMSLLFIYTYASLTWAARSSGLRRACSSPAGSLSAQSC